MRHRVAQRLGFVSVDQMSDALEPDEVRRWIAVALIDQWGLEWKNTARAMGAKFDGDEKKKQYSPGG